MEQTNRSLVFLVGLAFLVIGVAFVSVTCVMSNLTEKIDNISNNISKTSESMAQTMSQTFIKVTEDNDVVTPPHPYNECIKLLIDQTNRENKESDFAKMKAVCSVLSTQEKLQK